MVEYGQGVGQATGASGTLGGGGGTHDLGADVGAAFHDAVHTVSTLPPQALVLIIVLVFVGLIILRRAF
ncbi:MAG TPA: hypothetical protein VGM28_01280 [Candidatus Limnocylindrales bacterium]|jgi:hypothetical protein